MNISTRKEYLTGNNGYYETDQVQPANNSFGQIVGRTDGSFRGGMTGEVLVGKPNYTQEPILHNNISPAVLEQNMDNKVFIDAEFRDTSFTDSKTQPFKFTVRFKNSESLPITELVTLEYDGTLYSYSKYPKGGREIVFPYVYHNVNYVIVDALIMPTNIEYVTLENGKIVKTTTSIINDQRYIVLKIDKLNTCKKVSNNPKIDDTCFIMRIDKCFGVNSGYYIPIHDQSTSFRSRLQTIDKLDIEICDNKGNRLYPTLDGAIHNFHKDYQESIEVFRKLITKPNQDEKIKFMENRLMSLKDIVESIDPEIHLTINNVAQQIDTDIKYRR